MYKVILAVLLYFSSLHASLVGSNFNKQDMNILRMAFNYCVLTNELVFMD